MNPIAEVVAGRKHVMPEDQRWVGGGALSGLLLDLIGIARMTGVKPTVKQVRVFAELRGMDVDDCRDVVAAFRRWRP